jgi:hypothetical protein
LLFGATYGRIERGVVHPFIKAKSDAVVRKRGRLIADPLSWASSQWGIGSFVGKGGQVSVWRIDSWLVTELS